MMGMRGGGRDCFVVVSYDFEYSTEDGKRVWMKEGEVLLLLAKTNNDWWQVSQEHIGGSFTSVVYPELFIPGPDPYHPYLAKFFKQKLLNKILRP